MLICRPTRFLPLAPESHSGLGIATLPVVLSCITCRNTSVLKRKVRIFQIDVVYRVHTKITKRTEKQDDHQGWWTMRSPTDRSHSFVRDRTKAPDPCLHESAVLANVLVLALEEIQYRLHTTKDSSTHA